MNPSDRDTIFTIRPKNFSNRLENDRLWKVSILRLLGYGPNTLPSCATKSINPREISGGRNWYCPSSFLLNYKTWYYFTIRPKTFPTDWNIALGGFDPPTFELWAQHASKLRHKAFLNRIGSGRNWYCPQLLLVELQDVILFSLYDQKQPNFLISGCEQVSARSKT